MIGTVVRADAGRDKGRFFAIIACDGDYILIADGKKRKLCAPKRKSLKHVKFTNTVIELPQTDKGLRAALHRFNYGDLCERGV